MDNAFKFIEIRNSVEFGHSCRRIRYVNNISQEKLALDIGVSTSTIQRIENGKMAPSIDLVCRIAKGHGMRIIIISKDISSSHYDYNHPLSTSQGEAYDESTNSVSN